MRHHKERIELTDTLLGAMLKLAEGNPGAATALGAMCKAAPIVDPDSVFGPYSPLLFLDAHGIYGARIWKLYKYVCGGERRKRIQVRFPKSTLKKYKQRTARRYACDPRNWVTRDGATYALALLRAVQLGLLGETELCGAIDNDGGGINLETILACVQNQLPRFAS